MINTGMGSRQSTNFGVPPRSKKGFKVLTKVYDGTINSSPSLISHNIDAISNASVQEVVNKV